MNSYLETSLGVWVNQGVTCGELRAGKKLVEAV